MRNIYKSKKIENFIQKEGFLALSGELINKT